MGVALLSWGLFSIRRGVVMKVKKTKIPYSNTGSRSMNEGGLSLSFDWFQVSIVRRDGSVDESVAFSNAVISQLLGVVVSRFDFVNAHVEYYQKGANGYKSTASIKNGDDVLFRVLYNGSQRSMPINITASGDYAEVGRSMLQELCAEYSYEMYPTRIDVAYDFIGDFVKAFIYLSKKKGRIKSSLMGDWEGRQDGRTYYLGSKNSRARLRLYEKGIEVSQRGLPSIENWQRLELQFRPLKQERWRVRSYTAEQFVGAVRWVYDLFSGISGLGVDAHSPIRWSSETNLRYKVYNILKKYSSTFDELINAEGGIDAALSVIREIMKNGKDGIEFVEEVRSS